MYCRDRSITCESSGKERNVFKMVVWAADQVATGKTLFSFHVLQQDATVSGMLPFYADRSSSGSCRFTPASTLTLAIEPMTQHLSRTTWLLPTNRALSSRR